MNEKILELVDKERIQREQVVYHYDEVGKRRVRKGLEKTELVRLTFSNAGEEVFPSVYFNMTVSVGEAVLYPIGSKWKLLREENL